MSPAEVAKLPPLVVHKRTGSPPRRLVVRDLRKGTGAPVRRGDAVFVRYYEASFEKALQKAWVGGYGPTRYGLNEVVKGWQLGLPGMKVGGRRELIVPPRLHYAARAPQLVPRKWTSIYVIDLVGVEPGGAAGF